MPAISSKKLVLYSILLIGTICFFLWNKIQASYPLGQKDLKGHTLLATQANMGCDTCDIIEYYRDRETTCVIQKVESTAIAPYKVKDITSFTLKERLKYKEGNLHIYPLDVRESFSQKCFDLSQ